MVSENQLVREYYGNVALFLLRSYATLQLSYLLLTSSGHGDYHKESELFEQNFKGQYEKFQQAIEEMLVAANRDLWKCDPNPYFNKSNISDCVFGSMCDPGYILFFFVLLFVR